MLTRMVAWDGHLSMRRGGSPCISMPSHSCCRPPWPVAAGLRSNAAAQRRMQTPPGHVAAAGSGSGPESGESATGAGRPKQLPPSAVALLADAAAKLLAAEGGTAPGFRSNAASAKAAGKGSAGGAAGSRPSSSGRKSSPPSEDSSAPSPKSSSGAKRGPPASPGPVTKTLVSRRSLASGAPGSKGAAPGSKGAAPGSKGAAPGGARGRSSSSQSSSSDSQRLAKVMAAAGVASRRACETLIEEGNVKVNGIVVKQQGTVVRPDKDIITVNGKRLALPEQPQLYYFIINKPKGYICSNVDTAEGKGKRVIDILQPWTEDWSARQKDKKLLPPRFFTVGRLDVASHGLILVTNDGHWAQKVIHPSSDMTKEYIVRVDKPVPQSGLEAILKGTEVEGSHVAPVEVSTLESKDKLRVVVKEGKKHEVRQLVANAGFEVQSLKRVRIGGLRLPSNLGLGAYKQMSAKDIKAVTDAALQEQQRRNAWASATKLLIRQEE